MISTADHGLDQIINVSNYNTLTKLLSVNSYILRFLHNCGSLVNKLTGTITPSERKQANLLWILNTQQVITNEILNIRSNFYQLPLVRQLRLFLDKSGAIRCGGRIHNALATELAKFPYLLPAKHPFTTLVVHAIHKMQLHARVNATLTAIRQDYWIPSARITVRKLVRQCVICQKWSENLTKHLTHLH